MIELQALMAMCAMATVLFASVATHSRLSQRLWLLAIMASLTLFTGGMLGGVPFGAGQVPPANQLALTISLLSLLLWLLPGFTPWLAGLGTLVASQCLFLLTHSGVSAQVAVGLWLGASLGSYLLTRHLDNFSNARLRDESTLMLAALGLVIALVPSLLTQWDTAQRLASLAVTEVAHDNSRVSLFGRSWLFALIVLPLLAGLLYQYCRDRK